MITWVDGDDPAHRKKRQQVLAGEPVNNRDEVSTGRNPTRFVNNNELACCIDSIRAFAPWIRHIYVVTDQQVPAFLTPETRKKNNIHIVDHSEIFRSYEWALPTFNSRTIETALWRIPGLAPRFIYFNDDFVLAGKVTPGHFFQDGRVVLRGEWNTMIHYGPVRMWLNQLGTFLAGRLLGITRTMHLLLQIRSARLAGFSDRYFRVPHVPHAVRTETLRDFFQQNPSVFEGNITYPFRSTAQFTAIYLAHHLEIKKQNAVLRKADDFVMINGETDYRFLLYRKLKLLQEQKVRFACLHAMEKFDDADQSRIRHVIDQLIRDAS